MVRKPNYRFERQEREKAKAAKKAARLEANRERAKNKNAENVALELNDDALAGSDAGSQVQPQGQAPGQPQENDDPDR